MRYIQYITVLLLLRCSFAYKGKIIFIAELLGRCYHNKRVNPLLVTIRNGLLVSRSERVVSEVMLSSFVAFIKWLIAG